MFSTIVLQMFIEQGSHYQKPLAKEQHPGQSVLLIGIRPEPQQSSVTGLHGRAWFDWKINIHTLV